MVLLIPKPSPSYVSTLQALAIFLSLLTNKKALWFSERLYLCGRVGSGEQKWGHAQWAQKFPKPTKRVN